MSTLLAILNCMTETASSETPEYRFDFAVSFAGEDRGYVEEVVKGTRGERKVFYDEDYQVEMWGEDLVEYFTDLYQHQARYVVMFISRHYAEKMWTNLERRSALVRAFNQRGPYILPVRLDDTQLPGLLPTVSYLDARRVGLSGLIEAIKLKVAGSAPVAVQQSSDTKVPRSKEAIQALMTEREGLWEYRLYAGLLRLNLDELEPKYRDHVMGYARSNETVVTKETLHDRVQAETSSLLATIENFNRVLGSEVQEAAFGRPGEPGEVDHIVHLAQRFVSVYEDLMDWSTNVRGMVAIGDHTRAALQALAKAADQPLKAMRSFVEKFVAEMDTIEERLAAGETGIEIEMVLKPELDETVSSELVREVEAALRED